jgi:O-acetylhomoserine (thiol)-lyase
VVFTDAAGPLAFIIKARTTLLRDTGAALSPMHAFFFLQGLETLSLRVERHVENALKAVDYLAGHPKVIRVNHPKLADHPNHALYRRYFRRAGSILPLISRAARAAKGFIDRQKLISRCPTCGRQVAVIHPPPPPKPMIGKSSWIRHYAGTIRLSVGTGTSTHPVGTRTSRSKDFLNKRSAGGLHGARAPTFL